MLHGISKKIAFFAICVLCLSQGAVRAQSVMGQFIHKSHNPYPVERRFLWHPAKTTKGLTESNMHALVILAEYSDVRYVHTVEEFENTLIHKEKSARQYFRDQLGINMDITVIGPVKTDKKRSYYGTNNAEGKDTHPGEFIADVCVKADELVDFSLFDDDGDGYVDNIYIFYSGEDESQQKIKANGEMENSNFMWAHSWTLEESDYGTALTLDEVKINAYACSSELFRIYDSTDDFTDVIAPIGTFCHERSHIFGLSDLYDTDYEKSGGIAAGVWGKTSLMDNGNYNDNGATPPNFNAIDLETVGKLIPEEIQAGRYTLLPLGTEGAKTYRITNPLNKDEYYLFECRTDSGWDEFIGGKGLLVYHIDRSNAYSTMSETLNRNITSDLRWSPYNQVNCRPDHQCADLIEADGRTDESPSSTSKSNIAGIFFPQSGATAIGGKSTIKLSYWDGSESSLSVNEISMDNGAVTFLVKNEDSPIPPSPVNPPEDTDMLFILVLDDGESLRLKASNDVGAREVKWYFNGNVIENPSAFIPSGNGTIRVEIVWPDGSTDYIMREWNGRH